LGKPIQGALESEGQGMRHGLVNRYTTFDLRKALVGGFRNTVACYSRAFYEKDQLTAMKKEE